MLRRRGSFLHAIVDLDTTQLDALGFEFEDSPHLEGARLVVHNPSPSLVQWMAVATMIMAFAVVTVWQCRSSNSTNRRLVLFWTISLFASCLHNVDNILRPGIYFTPSWIVLPKIAFPMDQGFILWMLFVLGSGIAAITVQTQCIKKMAIIMHSFTTSFGVLHYVAQDPREFSIFAHLTICFESVMGVFIGTQLWSVSAATQARLESPRYEAIPRQQGTRRSKGTRVVEMTPTTGVRQRSVSPAIK